MRGGSLETGITGLTGEGADAAVAAVSPQAAPTAEKDGEESR